MKLNAEKVRSFFVAHKGQKPLEVNGVGNRYTCNFAGMAKMMANLIKENLVDPSFGEWVMPDFTTTTDIDKTAAAILMMGAMQEYFSYGFSLFCGLPSVTLLGDKSDWDKLLTRIELLPKLGQEPDQWYRLLKPVLTRFVRTFDSPESSEIKDFWQNIAHHHNGGSGPTYLSGWITAFCFWDWKGGCLFRPHCGAHLTVLDGVQYHRVDTDDVPPGSVSVPVKLNDNGNKYDTIMVAGSVGIKATSSRGMLTGLDTVQPESGWWMYEKKKG
jgi:hypothetical protein